MSDRTQGSVRTESPAGDVDAPDDTPKGAPKPVAATQAIPTTGSPRAAQAPATGSTPATPTSAGSTPANGASAGATIAAAPATGASKAAPATGASKAPPTAGTPTGAPATSAPAGQRAGSPAVAGPVPPATGPSPAVAPQQTTTTAIDATTATEPTSGRGAHARGPSRVPGRGPRRARLQLRHIDTWSALKISLVLSIALFFIWMVAVGVLYGVLSALGVFNTLNDLFGQIGSASGAQNRGDVVTPGVVFGGAAVIGAVNIVLLTALCTVGTFIYNLCSDLVGGLELTLSERD
jgi:hypothetical protein